MTQRTKSYLEALLIDGYTVHGPDMTDIIDSLWDFTVFVGSGVGHQIGLVPDPGASGGTTRFLREDATWAVPTPTVLDGTFVVENTADPTKQFNWSLGSMTTGTELTLASVQSTSQTLTIPNLTASDTLATLGLAQTFSAINTFSNTTDASSSIAGGTVISGGLALAKKLIGGSTITGTQLISNIATGTAPLVVASTTNVANLNASSLNGATFASPGAIGGTSAAAGTFTGLTVTQQVGSAGLLINGGTQTASSGAINLNQTWNNAGATFQLIQATVTDTASAAGSLFLNFINSSSVFSVTKAGALTSASSGTFSGNIASTGATAAIIVGSSTATSPQFILNGAAANTRQITWQTANNARWGISANNAAESGSDAGSAWLLSAFNDAGTFIDNPIVVTRASAGTITIGGSSNRPVSMGGALTVATETVTGDAFFGGRIVATDTASAYQSTTTTSIYRGNSAAFAANSLIFQSGGTTTGGGGFYWGLNNGTTTSTVMELNSSGLTVSGLSSGSIVYAGASGLLTTTAASTTQNFAYVGPTSGSGAPTFRLLVAGDIPSLPASQITSGQLATAQGGTGLDCHAAANGTLLIGNGTGFSLSTLTAGTNVTISNTSGVITINATGGGGGGSVSSVGLTVPSILSVSGSPITTSGTFTVTLATQTANLVFAGPASGSAAAPTFRGLVPLDMPVFVASGASHASGSVPDPGSSAGTTRFLREDASFNVPPTFMGDAGSYALISGTQLFLPCNDNPTASPTNLAGTGALTATAVTSVLGKFGNGFSLNGSSSTINGNSAGLIPACPLGGSFTIAFWFKTTTTIQSTVFVLAGGSPQGNIWVTINDVANSGSVGALSFAMDNGTLYSWDPNRGNLQTSSTSLNNGAWHFVVFQKTPSLASIWVDNVADNTAVVGTEYASPANNNLYIGSNQALIEFYNGSLDEVQYYSTTLTSGQRTTLYTLGLAGLAVPGVVGYVPAPAGGDAALGKVLGADGTWHARNQLSAVYSTSSAVIAATTAYWEYTGSGGDTATLPSTGTVAPLSLAVMIKNRSAGTLTVAASGGNTIEDGVSTTLLMQPGQSVFLVENQVSNWGIN